MKKIFIFILCPLILTISGEFLLKTSINKDTDKLQTNFSSIRLTDCTDKQACKHLLSQLTGDIKIFLSDIKIVIALVLIILGGVFWLSAMSKFELSFLYPFLSINYLAIVVGSRIFLLEQVPIYRYISILLIIIGLVIISQSPYSESEDKKNEQK